MHGRVTGITVVCTRSRLHPTVLWQLSVINCVITKLCYLCAACFSWIACACVRVCACGDNTALVGTLYPGRSGGGRWHERAHTKFTHFTAGCPVSMNVRAYVQLSAPCLTSREPFLSSASAGPKPSWACTEAACTRCERRTRTSQSQFPSFQCSVLRHVGHQLSAGISRHSVCEAVLRCTHSSSPGNGRNERSTS